MNRPQQLIFELSVAGRHAVDLPAPEVPTPSLFLACSAARKAGSA